MRKKTMEKFLTNLKTKEKIALDHWQVEISTHWPNLAIAILIWRVQF
jgi:hypothetical protein